MSNTSVPIAVYYTSAHCSYARAYKEESQAKATSRRRVYPNISNKSANMKRAESARPLIPLKKSQLFASSLPRRRLFGPAKSLKVNPSSAFTHFSDW